LLTCAISGDKAWRDGIETIRANNLWVSPLSLTAYLFLRLTDLVRSQVAGHIDFDGSDLTTVMCTFTFPNAEENNEPGIAPTNKEKRLSTVWAGMVTGSFFDW